MPRLVLAVAFFVLGALAAPAQQLPPLAFGDVGYGGTGCPDGSALVIKSPDGLAATLVLTQYSVGDNGRSVDRKTCAVAVPIDVPEGVSVAVQAAAVRGYATLPDGVGATLTLEAFIAGDVGPQEETPVDSSGSFAALTRVEPDQLLWSACGVDVNLRLNTSLRTKGNAGAKAQVRAINLYRLAARAC